MQGVSTRKLDKVVNSLGIENLPRRQVRETAQGLYEQARSFRERSRTDEAYPVLWVDALYKKVRYVESYPLACTKSQSVIIRFPRDSGECSPASLRFHRTDKHKLSEMFSVPRRLATSLQGCYPFALDAMLRHPAEFLLMSHVITTYDSFHGISAVSYAALIALKA